MLHRNRKRFGARLLLVVALVLSTVLTTVPLAYAASLTSLSLTLSSSVPDDTGVTHTFDFTVGTGGATIRGIQYLYCTTGSGACTTPTGLSTTSAAIDAAGTDNEFDLWTVNAVTNGTVSITNATGDSTNTSPIIAFSGITNPSASGGAPTSFYVRITTYSDTGLTTVIDGPSQVVSAVIPAIVVSGTQDAILDLTVSAVSAGVSIGDSGDVKSTTSASTATTLPFGTFAPLGTGGEESKAVAHTISVVTNGAAGYSASVQGGATAAMTREGGTETISYVAANTDWVELSTAGFGVNAQDAAGAGNEANETEFGTVAGNTLQYEPISSAVTLASNTAPTAGVDTNVAYRVQVSGTQAAGDYSGTVNYTVLPNF
ncbi:MAG: hypothetical protein ACE5IG_02610 [Dehalococcoidia bacterium]